MPFLPTDAFPVDLLPDGRIRASAPIVWTGTYKDTVTVPRGYVSDLGTVPSLLRGLIPHDGRAARAFLVHDVLCDAVHQWQAAVDRWDAQERANEAAGRAGRGLIVVQGRRPDPLPFDAVDTDAVLRVILAELGAGPVRWIYWEGVRAGALGSRARRRGWRRTLLPFVLLAVPTLLVVLPAFVGAFLSRVLLALVSLVAWPWEARARAKRAATVDRVRRVARGREAIARAGRYRCTCPPSDYEPGDHRPGCAEGKSRESATRTETSGGRAAPVDDLAPCACGDWRHGPNAPHWRSCPARGPAGGHDTWIRTGSIRESSESAARTTYRGPLRRVGSALARAARAVGRFISNCVYALLEAL